MNDYNLVEDFVNKRIDFNPGRPSFILFHEISLEMSIWQGYEEWMDYEALVLSLIHI